MSQPKLETQQIRNEINPLRDTLQEHKKIPTPDIIETSLYGQTKYIPLEYGKQIQYTIIDTSPELTPLKKNHIQKVYGKFLYDTGLVNSTELHMLNELSINKKQQL